ncbi:MAG: hypothetical protein J6Y16_09340 [Treponema sp.]|nr:hypothetical protein [Treponema sp.]
MSTKNKSQVAFKENKNTMKKNERLERSKCATRFIELCKADGKWETMEDKYKQWLCDMANMS